MLGWLTSDDFRRQLLVFRGRHLSVWVIRNLFVSCFLERIDRSKKPHGEGNQPTPKAC